MKSRLIYFFCFFYLISFSQKKNTFHKAKINYSSSKDLNILEENGISVEHGIHKKNYFLISDFSENELETIKNLGLNYSIIIENVTEYYKNQNRIKISENNSITGTLKASGSYDFNESRMQVTREQEKITNNAIDKVLVRKLIQKLRYSLK